MSAIRGVIGRLQAVATIDTTLWEITRKHFDLGAQKLKLHLLQRQRETGSEREGDTVADTSGEIRLGAERACRVVMWRECAAMYFSCLSGSETLFKIKPKRFK